VLGWLGKGKKFGRKSKEFFYGLRKLKSVKTLWKRFANFFTYDINLIRGEPPKGKGPY